MRVVLALFLCLCLLPMTARAATAAPPTLVLIFFTEFYYLVKFMHGVYFSQIFLTVRNGQFDTVYVCTVFVTCYKFF